jgi:hypothetical protein
VYVCRGEVGRKYKCGKDDHICRRLSNSLYPTFSIE